MTSMAQEKEGIKAEGAHEAEFNSDAQDRDASGEIDSRVQPSEDREGPPADAGNQQPENIKDASSGSVTVGTETRTASPSGSPGILVGNPDEVDGTNTVQRAKPNMAGSPVPGGTTIKTSGKPAKPEDQPSKNKQFSGKEQQSVPADTKAQPRREIQNNKKK